MKEWDELPDSQELIDPDPMSTLILVLGSVGSVASIASYVGNKCSSKREERQRFRFDIRDVIMGVETSLIELEYAVKSLETVFVVGTSQPSRSHYDNNSRDAMESLARFGSVQLFFTREGYDRWNQIEDSIIASAGNLNRYISRLLALYAATHYRLSDDVARRLVEAIDSMNKLLSRLQQIHFRDLFDEMQQLLSRCHAVMKMLRQDSFYAGV